MRIDAYEMSHRELNKMIKSSPERTLEIHNLSGQRYIASGSSGKDVRIYGVPGNALASFLDGSTVEVFDDAEDAVGDTMNDGMVIIHGSAGDAPGYAMRGGRIYIRDNAGYRAGIHMKAYREKQPLIIIGGSAGSFLGEYQAGGTIIVLGINQDGKPPVGYFTGTGMHGGRIILRSDELPWDLPGQVSAREADEKDREEIRSLIDGFCSVFSLDADEIMEGRFFLLTPDSANPYKRLYTQI